MLSRLGSFTSLGFAALTLAVACSSGGSGSAAANGSPAGNGGGPSGGTNASAGTHNGGTANGGTANGGTNASAGTHNGGTASGGTNANAGSTPGGSGGSGGAPARSNKGISGWLYQQDAALASALQSYDSAVQTKPVGADRRVRYLFPYGGGIGLTGSKYAAGALTYDPAAAAFYAARLPNADMLPNIDSADGAALATFSAADQEKLASDVASAILQDPSARGVHIDIEPFRDEHAPFYAKLKSLLHGGNKQLTLFTGRTSGPIYETADIVVLSGYDLGIEPVTVQNYESTLRAMVTTALASANAFGSSLLVGIPVSASYEEYATQSGTCAVSTGVTQEQWVAAALSAVCPQQANPRYLGIALWQVGAGALEIHAEPGCLRHPDAISDAVWQQLESFDPGQCP